MTLVLFVFLGQKSVTSWWSSSNAWSNNRNPASSCCRTCRSFSVARQKSNWNIPAVWTNSPRGFPPKSAAPGNTSSSSTSAVTFHLCPWWACPPLNRSTYGSASFDYSAENNILNHVYVPNWNIRCNNQHL